MIIDVACNALPEWPLALLPLLNFGWHCLRCSYHHLFDFTVATEKEGDWRKIQAQGGRLLSRSTLVLI